MLSCLRLLQHKKWRQVVFFPAEDARNKQYTQRSNVRRETGGLKYGFFGIRNGLLFLEMRNLRAGEYL